LLSLRACRNILNLRISVVKDQLCCGKSLHHFSSLIFIYKSGISLYAGKFSLMRISLLRIIISQTTAPECRVFAQNVIKLIKYQWYH
jgi:hypothetical protein